MALGLEKDRGIDDNTGSSIVEIVSLLPLFKNDGFQEGMVSVSISGLQNSQSNECPNRYSWDGS